ncbi:hypothetical protein DPMN_017780 [Dreissena polymorpha]|uniref:Uncharacterized protein n=1 Tax=Dreissena polymorpha TaxID=45954 RepID=A0A9D4NC17_DREPO|nr:hypothetical protein DPMN_017780 [Dreissena polymorpha]
MPTNQTETKENDYVETNTNVQPKNSIRETINREQGTITSELERNKYQEETDISVNAGYWSSKVADFLPLALANHTGLTVHIYTSKAEQPVIVVQPSFAPCRASASINIAYISAINVLEHYDAREPIATTSNGATQTNCENTAASAHGNENEQMLIATPIPASQTTTRTPRKMAKFLTHPKKNSAENERQHQKTGNGMFAKKLILS